MAKLLNPEEMTSRDYYFDSYAHFGIHEVIEGPVWMVLPSSVGLVKDENAILFTVKDKKLFLL